MPEFCWREGSANKKLTDHTYCPGFCMVLSEKAKNILLPYLEKSGAVVPIKIDDFSLFGYATWITFEGLNDHDGVTEFAYNKNRRTHLFVSEEVKVLIEEAGLTGFQFDLAANN